MTTVLSGFDVAHRIEEKFSHAVVKATPEWVEVAPERLLEVCTHLRDEEGLGFGYLISVTAVDRLTSFEVVYHLQSIRLNQTAVLKVPLREHENPEMPSVVPLWRGAQLQEREIYDLMGIHFSGHPDMRRIFLWEGFPGYPLRKDWLNMPGQRMAGLERFPGEPGGLLEGRG